MSKFFSSKKFKRVAASGKPLSSNTAKEAALTTRMGQYRDQVSHVLVELFNEFLPGGIHQDLFLQSDSGKSFHQISPTIRISNQFQKVSTVLISFTVGLLIEYDSDLNSGFEYDPTIKRIVQRISGKIPILIDIQARSEEELSILHWGVSQILKYYVARLYSRTISNAENNWQIVFPKVFSTSSKTSKFSEGGVGADEMLYANDISFSVFYEGLYVENKEHSHIEVSPKLVPEISILPVSIAPSIKLGGCGSYRISHTNAIASFGLVDATIGRIEFNDKTKIFCIFGTKIGKTTLFVRSDTFEATIDVEVTLKGI